MTTIQLNLAPVNKPSIQVGQFYHRPAHNRDIYMVAAVRFDEGHTTRMVCLNDGNRYIDNHVTSELLEKYGFEALPEGSTFTVSV